MILIDVTDEHEIIGMDLSSMQDMEKTVIEICKDSIDPSAYVFIQKLEVNKKIS